MHTGLRGAAGVHALYIVFLLCREGGTAAWGGDSEHCCSANGAVDMVYDSERYVWFGRHTDKHTHTHTHTLIVAVRTEP